MKKIVSLILACLLILSLATITSCSKAADDAKADPAKSTKMSKEELEATLPEEYILEKIDAGIEVVCQFSGFVDNEYIMSVFGGYVQEVCDEYGIRYEATHAGGDTANQISQIENYITMSSNIIFLVPESGAAVKDAVLKAQQAGIAVIIFGCEDAVYAVGVYGSTWVQGYYTAEVMYDYFTQHNPDAGAGAVKVGFLGTTAISNQLQKYTGMTQSLELHEEFDVAYTFDGLEDTIDSGFNAAETMMTYDPEISYILVQSIQPTIGVNNYLEQAPNTTPDNTLLFASNYDNDAQTLLDAGAAGTGYLKATAGPDKFEGEYMQDLLVGVINGEYVKDHLVSYSFVPYTAGWDCAVTQDIVDMSTEPEWNFMKA